MLLSVLISLRLSEASWKGMTRSSCYPLVVESLYVSPFCRSPLTISFNVTAVLSPLIALVKDQVAEIIDIIRKGLEMGRFNTNQQVPSMYGNKMAESMDCDAQL